MDAVRVPEFETRQATRPEGWPDDMPCSDLSIIDMVVPIGNEDVPFMASLWQPTAEELATLNAGGLIRIGISGVRHPVMFVDVCAVTQKEDGS